VGKITLAFLTMLALSIIINYGQGQMNQPITSSPEQNLVPGPLLETISVLSESPDPVYTQDLEAGKYYIIQASGVFSYWDDRTEGADAFYDYEDKYVEDGVDTIYIRPLEINDQSMYSIAKDNGHSFEFNPDHIYMTTIIGAGKPLKLRIWDLHLGSYNGNHGSLEVKLFASQDVEFAESTPADTSTIIQPSTITPLASSLTPPSSNLGDSFTIQSEARSSEIGEQVGYFELKIDRPELIQSIEIVGLGGTIDYVIPLEGGSDVFEVFIAEIGVVSPIPLTDIVLQQVYNSFKENRNNVEKVVLNAPNGIWLVKVRPAARITVHPNPTYFKGTLPGPISRVAPFVIPTVSQSDSLA